MWRTGKRLYGNASDLVTMIKTLSGVSLGSDLQPRGVWKTDSKTTATATQQRNVVASTLRTTAISEAAYAVTRLPGAHNFRGDAECHSGAVNNTRAEHRLAFCHASGTEQCTGGEKHG